MPHRIVHYFDAQKCHGLFILVPIRQIINFEDKTVGRRNIHARHRQKIYIKSEHTEKYTAIYASVHIHNAQTKETRRMSTVKLVYKGRWLHLLVNS